ncbi:protein-disulfide reductase DsbD domain-containing protein [Humisphaera borealis]|uniref:Thiol:disulfide interchange protein DsbD N-terminal domain-containing protein n=1 Tax=Humisphaera borealis TaxID=2807512 RepID=A0A7M2X0T2_9BACT|nr:protein-disulfide reductase DsbD domain-containing protein [Humisphaera borealis]QOV91303.1 hypothetical protein IPV69_08085 [Humisphaera borealis]
MLLACGSLAFGAPGVPKELVKATLFADVETVSAGSAFHVGVVLKMAPHWHTYWINPGETGTPTSIKLTGPKGFSFGKIQWPTPTKIVMDGAITYGYEDEVLLRVPVSVAKDADLSGAVTIDADVEWLSCKDTCIEGSAKLSINLAAAATTKPANGDLFGKWASRLTVGRDHPSAAAVEKIEQPAMPGGEYDARLNIAWKQRPEKVEWFPVATPAVAIENIEIKHDGNRTTVHFKPNVFDAKEVPRQASPLTGGIVDGVLVWTTESGQRIAVAAPVVVSLKK